MLYQEIVTRFPAVSTPGCSHNNRRETSLYATGRNLTATVQPGIAQVVTGYWDHTRLELENPTAANLVADARLVIVHDNSRHPNAFTTNRIGQLNSTTTRFIPSDCLLRVAEEDEIYVIVEKEIDPSLPVFIRVANPDVSGLQGIGFFTDTADGANTVEVTSLIARTRWVGSDSFSFLSAKDSNITQPIDARRMGMETGFAIAPLRLLQS